MDGLREDLEIEGLTPERSVMLLGPPMTGKYDLMLDLLARYADSAILISTRNDAGTARDDLVDASDIPPGRVGVIDCAGRHGGADDDLVTSVNSPGDLTSIGVAFTDLYGRFEDDPEAGHVGVGLHSLSQLVMHTNDEQVYQFLQVLGGQIRGAGWFHAAVMDSAAVDDKANRVLQHHFDGVIETRDSDGAREFRTRGLTASVSAWRPF